MIGRNFIAKWSKKVKAINLLGGKCLVCGNKDLLLLDFHHIKDKTYNVNSLLGGRWSKIENEINSCVLLCANCHSELHCNLGGRHAKFKKEFLKSLGVESCKICGWVGKNYASLEFHHRDERSKNFLISQVINRNIKVSVEAVYEELSKCDVICRNCHRKFHKTHSEFEMNMDKIIKKSLNIKEKHKKLDRSVIVSMYESGKKQIEIARFFGCAKSTISDILKFNQKVPEP